ncbi:SurA N-terminal domain-containing protein [Silvanigrella aquatica]|uniref:PpiC domain-containing protein n=1 Tax=Silvanigrella aquatica TaxID=1915309 RepID=A0A1L4CX01_9BACT|nr:SurA N-terminal domain-containing protein [Silvanigrella aquatica]APJ02475.1 hypothetical protein AXG55_00410 [Silvanigrella aquatica]
MNIKKIEIFTAIVCSFSLFSACTTSKKNDIHPNSSQIITSLAPTTPFDANTLDGVLATIADQVILLSDLQQAIFISTNGQTRLSPNGRLYGGNLVPQQASQIMESIINQKVLQVKAIELGLDVSEDDLSKQIDNFLKQRGFSEEELQNQLAKSGKSMKEYRQEFKNEVLKQELIGRVISSLVSVSDDEVKSFYLQQTGSIKQVSSVKLRSLLIKIPENEQTDPLNSELIKIISKKIEDGESFIKLVKEYSMASDATQTEGILPPRPVAELPAPIREKISNLSMNQVVGPFILGSSVFYFQYLGATFSEDSDLLKNFGHWKSKLQDIKFNERLSEYLLSERKKLKANIRPFQFSH